MAPNHKLTEQDVLQIKQLRRMGVSCAQIAEDYGVSTAAIMYHTGKTKPVRISSKQWLALTDYILQEEAA